MVPDEMNSDNSDVIDGKDVKMSIEEGYVFYFVSSVTWHKIRGVCLHMVCHFYPPKVAF